MTPFEIARAGFWLTMLNAGVAIVMYSVIVFALLRLADRISKVNFRQSLDIINDNPMALSVYLSARYFVLGTGSALILASAFLYS